MKPLKVPMNVLDEARIFFEDRGAAGCEGTALIAATACIATRLVVPEQVASPVPACRVEVTLAGKLSLASVLGANEHYAARIHSHPGPAFHSPTDDANPAITHIGALSIVVPYFGLGLRHGLAACAVYVLGEARGWIEVPPGLGRDDLVVAS